MTMSDLQAGATENTSEPGAQVPYRGPERRSTDAQHQSERIFLVVVDGSQEMSIALRFACRRAQHTGGRVALLYVMEPADFQHWMSVGEKMREERREEAERTLNGLASEVNDLIGATPTLYVREGAAGDEILKLIEEEPNISILVLGAGTDKNGPGPLVSSLAGKLAGKFPIPVTVVPGTLSLDRIDGLT
jgi:nucleotide-binding universal stress UspA family protein